jgi:hypothetical protein
MCGPEYIASYNFWATSLADVFRHFMLNYLLLVVLSFMKYEVKMVIIYFLAIACFLIGAYLFKPIAIKISFLILAGYALMLGLNIDFYSGKLFRITGIPLVFLFICLKHHFGKE